MSKITSEDLEKLRKGLGLNVEDAILEGGVSVNEDGISMAYETHNTFLKIDGKWFNVYTSEWGAFAREDPDEWLMKEHEKGNR